MTLASPRFGTWMEIIHSVAQSVTVQILRSTPEIAMLELESVNALKHTEELMIVQNVLKGFTIIQTANHAIVFPMERCLMSEEYHSVYLTQAKFNAPVKKTSQESFAINVPQDIITFLNANTFAIISKSKLSLGDMRTATSWEAAQANKDTARIKITRKIVANPQERTL